MKCGGLTSEAEDWQLQFPFCGADRPEECALETKKLADRSYMHAFDAVDCPEGVGLGWLDSAGFGAQPQAGGAGGAQPPLQRQEVMRSSSFMVKMSARRNKCAKVHAEYVMDMLVGHC